MQSLRKVYKVYQQGAYSKKPSLAKSSQVIKNVKTAEQQIQRMQTTNDYSNYDETVFYKEKFQALFDLTSKYQKKKIAKDVLLNQLKTLLGQDYNGVSFVQSKVVAQGQVESSNIQQSRNRQKSKSPLKQFFDQQDVKNSKRVTFSNLLSAQQTPLKYGLKSVVRSTSPMTLKNPNQGQIKRLKLQNERLRAQLDSEKSQHDGQDRFRELKSQISELSEQNRRLKSEVNSKASSRSDIIEEEDYDPYNIKIRENNLMRINSRNLTISERYSQVGSQFMPKQVKGSQIYYDQSELARSDFTYNPQHYSQNRSKQNVLLSEQDVLNLSHSTIQTQFLNMDQSQIADDEKHHICRQKIAFFKKSMVLYKGQSFDIAFKKSDLNTQLDRLRVILYVNNKENKKVNCTIEYDYERQDFDLTVKKRIDKVQPMGQGREELQVFFKNPTDLGSLITAKVLVGSVMKKIIVPALFIDFDPNYRLQFENIGYIERNLSAPLIIKPMGQFSTLENASNVLELTRQYDSRNPTAKLYGKSKVTKGVVILSWKQDKLKIQTCQEWRTLMGYLFLNAQQTIQY